MRKRLKRLILRITGGHLPIYVQQRALAGAKVTLLRSEDYELMLAELQWRWLRAFLIGMALVTAVGFASFVAGVRVSWVNEQNYFREACQRIIEKHFMPPPKKLQEAFEINYPVADWRLVPPENFHPKGYKP